MSDVIVEKEREVRDRDVEPRRSNSATVVAIVAIVLLVLIALFVLPGLFGGGNATPTTTTPNVTAPTAGQ